MVWGRWGRVALFPFNVHLGHVSAHLAGHGVQQIPDGFLAAGVSHPCLAADLRESLAKLRVFQCIPATGTSIASPA